MEGDRKAGPSVTWAISHIGHMPNPTLQTVAKGVVPTLIVYALLLSPHYHFLGYESPEEAVADTELCAPSLPLRATGD